MTTFNLKQYLSKQAELNPTEPASVTPSPTPEPTPAPENPTNPLDGKSNVSARSFVNRILSNNCKTPSGGSLFSDNYWAGITQIFNGLKAANIDYVTTGTQYIKDPQDPSGMPKSKEYKFEVRFTNNKGRPAVLYGVATAHGAGTTKDPLSRYDITAYAN